MFSYVFSDFAADSSVDIGIPNALICLVHVRQKDSVAKARAEANCVLLTGWKVDSVAVEALK